MKDTLATYIGISLIWAFGLSLIAIMGLFTYAYIRTIIG